MPLLRRRKELIWQPLDGANYSPKISLQDYDGFLFYHTNTAPVLLDIQGSNDGGTTWFYWWDLVQIPIESIVVRFPFPIPGTIRIKGAGGSDGAHLELCRTTK